MHPRATNIEQMKTAAEKGDPKAAFDLAWHYYVGSGVIQNRDEARKWYIEAANAGVPEAREIVRLLEAETQRDSELKALRSEAAPGHRMRRGAWFIIVPLALACLGSIAVMLYVLDHEAAMKKPSAASGRANPEQQEVVSTDVKAIPVPTKGQTNTKQAQVDTGDPPTMTMPADNQAAISLQRETGSVTMPVESGTQANPPSALKPVLRPAIDFNELATRATNWLEDVNDVSSASQQIKGTGQKHTDK